MCLSGQVLVYYQKDGTTFYLRVRSYYYQKDGLNAGTNDRFAAANRRGTRMKRTILVTLALLISAILFACATKQAQETNNAETQNEQTATEPEVTPEPAVPTLSESITLPDGWTMDQAITADDVSALTGLTYSVFSEAASAAQDGNPAGGFITDNL